jgi:hypothetical protein
MPNQTKNRQKKITDQNFEKVFQGKQPDDIPLFTQDFDDLAKKTIDSLIDSIKHITTSCGISIAIYSQVIQNYIKLQSISSNPLGKLLIFSPLFLWFLSLLFTIIGMYPKQYKATTDLTKQKAVKEIQKSKKFWLTLSLFSFIAGYTLLIYIVAAQLANLFPFYNE